LNSATSSSPQSGASPAARKIEACTHGSANASATTSDANSAVSRTITSGRQERTLAIRPGRSDERQPGAGDVHAARLRSRHEHLVPRPQTGVSERHERVEMARAAGRGEEDAHFRT
jgi:hypothetical protein